MIASLQSLRFVFAIMIFLHHYSVNGEGLFYAGGTCGVSFFMILSGFVMSAGYSDKVMEGLNKKDFILKRLIRLYPLHFLCLFSFLILHIAHISIKSYILLIPNALLVQSWIPIKTVYFSGNAVSWCLADMIFFYIMFPLLAKWIYRNELKRCVCLSVFLLFFYVVIMLLLPDKYCHPLLYISPIFRLLDFFIGMLTYKIFCQLTTKGWESKIKCWSYMLKSLIEILQILLLVIAIMMIPYLDVRYYYTAIWWLVMPGFILLFALFDKSGGVISSFLKNHRMLALGEISFSMYMVHQMGINVVRVLIGKLGLTMMWQVELILSFLIIVFISYIVFHYYEIPVSQYLKKKFI